MPQPPDQPAKPRSALPRDLLLFIGTVMTIGFAESIFNAVFNNFLSETFSLTSFYRTFLELPRESGGLLVIFVSALFFFLPGRRMAVVATLIGTTGLLLMAFFSVTVHRMFVWLFLFSLGQHLFMPLSTSIGMELAREGQTGRRLGQLNSLKNIAIISGSFFVFIGFKYLHLDFTKSFICAALFYGAGAVLLYSMKPGRKNPPAMHLKLHREYRLYYWLSVLFGTRKQIFLTFAPWVLVTVYHQPTAVIATLFTISGVCGIFFQPFLGKAIDRLGERFILSAEALLLIFVCTGYGFARNIFPEQIALVVACACFIADQLLMSVNMARSTYLKKIALHPDHITPTLSMSVSIDHVFSITVALLGGVVWAAWGYQAVFVAGAGIALVNLASARFIRVPGRG
jgi:predicted MFS family arabinose efflux permease